MRVALLIALVACGNDRAPVGEADAPSDATVLPDTTPPPAGCDWGEQVDPLNDITLGNGEAEVTNLTLDDMLVICGRVDNGHLIGDAVDVDGYRFAVAERTTLRIDLAGEASSLAALEVAVLDDNDGVIDRGAFLNTHVVFETTLPPGSYRVVVTATNATDIAAGFDYKLRLIASPAPCAQVTAAADYTESADGPQSDRNDMIEIRYATDERTLTAATNDDPEPSTVVTAAGTQARITGTSADVDGGDEFRDRDTYLIETGAHDELELRVDWTGAADLDVFLFPEDSVVELGSGTAVSKTAPERVVLPVLANTRYWLWVGAYDSSTGSIDYDVSICPTQFTP